MNTKAALVVCVLSALSLAAMADAPPSFASRFSGNIAITNNYVFRGVTLSDFDPAASGLFQYTDPSGIYVGTWLSSDTAWTQATIPGSSYHTETDIYAGWSRQVTKDFAIDFGVYRYQFPGRGPLGGWPIGITTPNTTELYADVTWKWLKLQDHFSVTPLFGIADSKHSNYVQIDAAIPIASSGFTVNLHAGHQNYAGRNTALWAGTGCTNGCLSYSDYSVGGTYTFDNYSAAIQYSHTNASKTLWIDQYGKFTGGNQWMLTLTRSF